VKILSNVPLLAQNNKEASVSVVQNIPILKSTIEGGSGTARDVIQNIERLDVGITLKVTPHVNPNGDVTMQLNPSIQAVIDEGSATTAFTPTIAKREISTTITVPDRQTVVISGLIREDQVKSVSKVPILGDIPILKWLFRHTRTNKVRNNLLVFVTPHIVTDIKQAAELEHALRKRASISVTATNLEPRVEAAPKKKE
jgi:general secretion pathway protein D